MKYKKHPRFEKDMKALDNLANAYNTCSDGFRDTWKQKWYEMCSVIAKRVQEHTENVDKRKH